MCNCPKVVKEYINLKQNNIEDSKLFLLGLFKIIENIDKIDDLTLRLEIYYFLKDNPEILNMIYWDKEFLKKYYLFICFRQKFFIINKRQEIKEYLKVWNTNLKQIHYLMD